MKMLFGLLICLVLVFSACSTPAEVTEPIVEEPVEEVAEPEVIKLGFIGPLTGDAAGIGIPIQTGIEFAVEEINAEGGINGKLIEVIYEDGVCKPKESTLAAQKLINGDGVQAIIGGQCSSETLAAAPIAEAAKVVMFSPASTNPDITNAGDFIFRAIGSDSFQGVTMADYVYEQGHRKVAVLYMNSDYNVGLRNVFVPRFEELGGEIIGEEMYEQEAKDFRTQLTKLKAKNPDAYYVIPYLEVGLIMLQAREMDIEEQFFGPETLESVDALAEAGEAMEGVIFTTAKFDPENDMTKMFLEKYVERYGEAPEFQAYVATAYDTANILRDAIAANGYTGEGIRDYLYTIENYNGAGGLLTIDENGDALKEYRFMTVKEGEFVDLDG